MTDTNSNHQRKTTVTNKKPATRIRTVYNTDTPKPKIANPNNHSESKKYRSLNQTPPSPRPTYSNKNNNFKY